MKVPILAAVLALTTQFPSAQAAEPQELAQGNPEHDAMMQKVGGSVQQLAEACRDHFVANQHAPYMIGTFNINNVFVGTPIYKYDDNYKGHLWCHLELENGGKYVAGFTAWFDENGKPSYEPRYLYLTDDENPPASLSALEQSIPIYQKLLPEEVQKNQTDYYFFVEEIGENSEGQRKQLWHMMNRSTGESAARGYATFTETPDGKTYFDVEMLK